MSKPLTIETVVEQLQQVLHNLSDLSNFGDHQPFQGVVLDGVEFHYRDQPPSSWRITIEQIIGVRADGTTITRREFEAKENGG